MDLLYSRCSGLDVHPRSVSACVRVVADGRVSQEVRTFGTSTRELTDMADWLASAGCTHVAMESTGVYWKPVWHVLEGRFELLLANAMYVKNIPGRKSDVKDAVWISDLLAHGLLRGSFVPPDPAGGPFQTLRGRHERRIRRPTPRGAPPARGSRPGRPHSRVHLGCGKLGLPDQGKEPFLGLGAGQSRVGCVSTKARSARVPGRVG